MYLIWRAFCLSKFQVGGEISRSCPDRPCGPPTLLHNGYRVTYPGVKRPGRGVDHPQPSNADVKERVQLHLYSPSGPSWPVLGRTLPLPLLQPVTDGCHSSLYTVFNVSIILIYVKVNWIFINWKLFASSSPGNFVRQLLFLWWKLKDRFLKVLVMLKMYCLWLHPQNSCIICPSFKMTGTWPQ